MRTRNIQINIRLNDEEHEHLLELVELTALSRSTLIRVLLMGKEIRERPPTLLPKLLHHLSSMSNNINQIARVANSNKLVDVNMLEEIKDMQSKLWREIRGL